MILFLDEFKRCLDRFESNKEGIEFLQLCIVVVVEKGREKVSKKLLSFSIEPTTIEIVTSRCHQKGQRSQTRRSG